MKQMIFKSFFAITLIVISNAGLAQDSTSLLEEVVWNGRDVSASDPISLVTFQLIPEFKDPRLGGMPISGCTATLIAPDVLITAAHCVKPFTLPVVKKGAVLAIYYRGLDGKEKSATMKRFIIHPKDTGEAGRYDLALIQLTKAILDRAPAKLPAAESFKDGDSLLVAGFGKNHRPELTEAQLKQDPVIAAAIKELNLIGENGNLQRRTELAGIVARRLRTLIRKQEVLLKTVMTGERANYRGGIVLKLNSKSTAICSGDSGGPSFISEGKSLFLMGVHSGGDHASCQAQNRETSVAGIDVLVSDFIPWISAQLKRWNASTVE